MRRCEEVHLPKLNRRDAVGGNESEGKRADPAKGGNEEKVIPGRHHPRRPRHGIGADLIFHTAVPPALSCVNVHSTTPSSLESSKLRTRILAVASLPVTTGLAATSNLHWRNFSK